MDLGANGPTNQKDLRIIKLSVVVPTHNNHSTLEACLMAIKASKYPPCELIVVDDGSVDDSIKIAKKFADKIIEHGVNKGSNQARLTGMREANNDIIVNIDSDIVIFPDTLDRIRDYFSINPETAAITGRLSKLHPNHNFFSQYKNLYMNYILGKQPEYVNFIFGSIHAIQKKWVEYYSTDLNPVEDTERGQRIIGKGGRIAFLRDLEVMHHKRYDFVSWIRNDYRVPYHWAKIFVRFKGWQTLGQNKTGYLHSPKEQLASVVLGPLSMLFGFAALLHAAPSYIAVSLFTIWFILNVQFIAFLWKERGIWFGIRSIFVTYLDHLIMATGIFFGLFNAVIKG